MERYNGLEEEDAEIARGSKSLVGLEEHAGLSCLLTSCIAFRQTAGKNYFEYTRILCT